MPSLNVSLLLLIITMANIADRTSRRFVCKRPLLTVGMSVAVAICFVVQLRCPGLLVLVERNARAVAAGQLYRLASALYFQDGGIPGGIFNLVALFLVGAAAERHLPRTIWLLAYMLGGLLTEVIALAWQPFGAGNSIAYMSLAGALFALELIEDSSRMARLAGLIGIIAGVALCMFRDIHGAAVITGVALCAISRCSSARPRVLVADRHVS